MGDEVSQNPSAYALILSGHHDNPDCNGDYTFGGEENGRPKWTKGHIKIFWTGGTWDICFGGYSPEAPINSRVPPFKGYTRDQGSCDILVRYEYIEQQKGPSLDEVYQNPSAYALILSGHHDHPDCNGRYTF